MTSPILPGPEGADAPAFDGAVGRTAASARTAASGHAAASARTVALAVDIGGTTLKGAAVDRSGRVVRQYSIGTFDVDGDAYAGVLAVIRMLRAGVLADGFRPVGVGLASPGLVDTSTGTIAFAANLGWDALPLARRLEAEFGIPVRVDHDARAAALAERAAQAEGGSAGGGRARDTGAGDAGAGEAFRAQDAGAGETFRNFMLIPIGTGVSAAIVASGVLVEGASGAAGEFGHIPAVPNGDLCACGQHGCIEAYASATSILRRYRARGGTGVMSTEALAAALDTDPVAAEVWHDAVEALAIGITALTAVLDPAVVVIGGGLSAAGDVLLVPLQRRVEERLGWRRPPLIVRSALTSQGGLIGAAMLGWAGHDLAPGFALRAHAALAAPPPYPAPHPDTAPSPDTAVAVEVTAPIEDAPTDPTPPIAASAEVARG